MQSVGVAEAKVILFGEHFVVYDGLAMACPVPEYQCVATLREKVSAGIEAESCYEERYRTRVGKAEIQRMDEKLNKLCVDFAQELGIESPHLHVLVQSNIPIGQGLGSSAALSVALIRAFSAYYSLALGSKYMEYFAFWMERHFHPNPSGIDHLTILYDFPIFFSKSSSYLPLMHSLSYYFVIASTGPRVGKDEAIKAIAQRSGGQEFKKLYDEADWLVSRALIAFESNDRRLLGKLMTRNHYLLQQLGVSTPKIEAFIEIALKHGALGAKLTGAGCGGCIIALVHQEDCAAVVEALKKAGAEFAKVVHMPTTQYQG